MVLSENANKRLLSACAARRFASKATASDCLGSAENKARASSILDWTSAVSGWENADPQAHRKRTTIGKMRGL